MPFAQFLFACAQWSLWAFLPVLLRDAGHPELVGRITALFQLTSAAVLLPAGWFTDRWPPRTLSMAANLVCAGGALAFAAGWPVAGAIGAGVGGSLFLVSIHALFYKRLAIEGAGSSTGRFVAAGLLGYAVGPLLGGQVAGMGLAVTGLVAALLHVGVAAACARLPSTEPVPVRLSAYLGDLRGAGPLFLVGVVVLTSTHSGVELVGLSPIAAEIAGLTPRATGVFYAIVGAWTAMSTLRIGRAFDDSPRPVLWLAVGLAMSGLFQASTGLAVGFGTLTAIRMAHTVGDALFGFVIAMLTSRVFPKARVGGLYALTQLVRTGSSGVAAGWAGAFEPWGGLDGAFVVSGVVLIGGAAAIVLFRSRVRELVGLAPVVG